MFIFTWVLLILREYSVVWRECQHGFAEWIRHALSCDVLFFVCRQSTFLKQFQTEKRFTSSGILLLGGKFSAGMAWCTKQEKTKRLIRKSLVRGRQWDVH